MQSATIWILSVAFTIAVVRAKAPVSVSTSSGPRHGKFVICSVESLNLYSNNGTKLPLTSENSSPLSLCTHLLIIFKEATLQSDRGPWHIQNATMSMTKIKLMKILNAFPHLQIVLSVHVSLNEFLEMANIPSELRQFFTYSHDFLLTRGFDGINLEFNDLENGQTCRDDLNQLVTFLNAYKEELNMSALTLSISLPLANNFFNNYKGFDLEPLAQSVYFINFIHSKYWATIEMTERELNTKNVEMHVNKLIKAGVPAKKMTIDLPFKGAVFDTNVVYGINFNRFIGYNETCIQLSNDEAAEWQGSYINNSDLALLENHRTNRAIVFESCRSIANKMRVAVKLGLLGAITGPVSLDDYEDHCGEDEDIFMDFRPAEGITLHIPKRSSYNFGLIRTINDAIEVTLDEIRQEAAKNEGKPPKPNNKPPSYKNTTTQGDANASHRSYNKYSLLISLLVATMIQFSF